MKVWSKEALVLGGIYSVLATPVSLLGFENMMNSLFLLFVICMVMLCFNKTPKFLLSFISNYPRISYYLSAIGWIVYFSIIGEVCIFVAASVFEWQDKIVESVMNGFNIISILGIPISLLVAFIRKKYLFRF